MDKEPLFESPNIIKGSLYAIVAFFSMAVFGLFTKVGLEDASPYWVSFIVYVTGTLVLLPYIIWQGSSYLKSEHYPSLIGRAVFGTIASFFYTISIHYIPIVNGTLLFNTAPVFIPLLSLLIFNKRIPVNVWIAVLIGFIGIIIIIKPTGAIFTQTGNLIGLLSGISLAIAYLLMKSLTATDPGIRIIFYYLGIGMLMQIPLLFFAGPLPTIQSCYYSILGGISLLIAQLLLVSGYRYAEASQIGVYQYMSVVFVGIFNWLLWNSAPSFGELIGALLVSLAGIIIIRSGKEQTKITKQEDL